MIFSISGFCGAVAWSAGIGATALVWGLLRLSQQENASARVRAGHDGDMWPAVWRLIEATAVAVVLAYALVQASDLTRVCNPADWMFLRDAVWEA